MPTACSAAPDPGRSPLRRLNLMEYLNTVADLFGTAAATQVADSFPPDEEGGGFSNNADALVVTGLLAGKYMDVSEKLAAVVAARPGTVVPCDPVQMGETACATRFVDSFGKRAFRRPLSAAERTQYLAFFTEGRKAGMFADGVELALQAFLQSPHFLYRVEAGGTPLPGGTGAVASVAPYEMASRLSYAFWGSMPDDRLFAAAGAGTLSTAAGIEAEARRMLDPNDPKTKRTVAGFHREWFAIGGVSAIAKDPVVYPTWSPSLRNDLRVEIETFIDQVFWTDGRLETLLSAPYSYLNGALAKHYGVVAPTDNGFVRVALDPMQRAGLLTNGALLSLAAKPDQTSPVHRGKFVREQLLCQQLPSPPALDPPIMAPIVSATASTRERFAQHTQPACAACHQLMDPIGFGFENYDAVGRWRTQDGKFNVDASGEVVATTGADGKFTGTVELAKRLGASVDARNCVTTQVFRYAAGRAETAGDACTIERMRKRLDETSHDMRELWVAVASSDAFRFRSVTGGGQ